jgi:2-amino-4-hydroxy-6-hydroxymethyldihydropteridine diphosphokinase
LYLWAEDFLGMAEVYFSLGSNEGNRISSLVSATKLIEKRIGKVIQNSSVVESEPWGFSSETAFYNMVLLVETALTPHRILTKVIEIEKSLGRIRQGKGYTNRIIDIDILFYGEEEINDMNLQIPHPLMQKRKFVLQPLTEIAPGLIHPVLKTSVAELLFRLNEPGSIPVVTDKDEFAMLVSMINKS